MNASEPTKREQPLAEPAAQQSGNEVGGMRAGADHGFSDPTQRSMEHDETSPLGRASTGNASGGAADPRLDLGGKNAPGSAATPTDATDDPAAERAAATRGAARSTGGADEDDDEWRHEPVEPVDEPNPLKSLGRAVADVATGGAEDTSNDDASKRRR